MHTHVHKEAYVQRHGINEAEYRQRHRILKPRQTNGGIIIIRMKIKDT